MLTSVAVRYIVKKFLIKKSWLFLFLLSALLSGFFEPLLALSMKKIVDSLSGSDGAYIYFVFAIPVLGVINNLCWRLMEYIQKQRHVDIVNSMVVDMFMHYLKRGAVNGEKVVSGSVSDRINTVQGAILNLSGFHFFGIIRSLTILFISFSISFYISPIYGFFSITWLAFVSGYIYYGNKNQSRLSGQYSGKVSSVVGYMTDTIYNISVVKSFGGRRVEYKNISDITNESALSYKAYREYAIKRAFVLGGMSDAYVLASVICGLILFESGDILAGTLVFIISQSGHIVYTATWCLGLLQQVIDTIGKCEEAMAHIGFSGELYNKESDLHEHKNNSTGEYSIIFDNVSHYYDDSQLAIDNMVTLRPHCAT